MEKRGSEDIICSGMELPFSDNSFDCAVSIHVAEHTTDPAAFFRESIRVAGKKAVHIVPGHPVEDRTHRVLFFDEKLLEETLEGLPFSYRPDSNAWQFRDWVVEIPKIPSQKRLIHDLLLSEEPSLLIILDACRFDAFESVNWIPGKLEKVRTEDSCTDFWVQEDVPTATFRRRWSRRILSFIPSLNPKGLNPKKTF